MFILSTISLTLFLFQVYDVHRAAQWPGVDAIVTKSFVTWSQEIAEGKFGSRVVQARHAFFNFGYEVSGRQYTSANFYWRGETPDDFTTEFPVGHHFRAIYNPKDPTEAAVAAGSVGYGWLIFSVITFGVALVGLIQYRSMMKASPVRKQ